jgi:hypothetical protein
MEHAPVADAAPPGGFSLASMMLFVPLAAIVLYAFRVHPALGIVVTGLFAPSFLRTVRVIRHRMQQGQRTTSAEKVATFIFSFCVVFSIVATAVFSLVVLVVFGGILIGLFDPRTEGNLPTLVISLGVLLSGLIFGLYVYFYTPKGSSNVDEPKGSAECAVRSASKN